MLQSSAHKPTAEATMPACSTNVPVQDPRLNSRHESYSMTGCNPGVDGASERVSTAAVSNTQQSRPPSFKAKVRVNAPFQEEIFMVRWNLFGTF